MKELRNALPDGYKDSLWFIPYTWSSSSSPVSSNVFDLSYSTNLLIDNRLGINVKFYLSTYHNRHLPPGSVQGCTKLEPGTLWQRRGGNKWSELSPCEYIPSENIITILNVISGIKRVLYTK